MAAFDSKVSQIVIRIVYDGAGTAGKTTNLVALQDLFTKVRRSELTTLETVHGRTLYFDHIQLEGGLIAGHRFRCELLTVPGQEELRTRRAFLLDRADVVIFVVDSRPAGVEEAKALTGALYGPDGAPRFPVVLQANKQDCADALPPPEVRAALDLPPDTPLLGAVAEQGTGVRDTILLAMRRAAMALQQRVIEQGPEALEEAIDEPIELYRQLRLLRIEFPAVGPLAAEGAALAEEVVEQGAREQERERDVVEAAAAPDAERVDVAADASPGVTEHSTRLEPPGDVERREPEPEVGAPQGPPENVARYEPEPEVGAPQEPPENVARREQEPKPEPETSIPERDAELIAVVAASSVAEDAARQGQPEEVARLALEPETRAPRRDAEPAQIVAVAPPGVAEDSEQRDQAQPEQRPRREVAHEPVRTESGDVMPAVRISRTEHIPRAPITSPPAAPAPAPIPQPRSIPAAPAVPVVRPDAPKALPTLPTSEVPSFHIWPPTTGRELLRLVPFTRAEPSPEVQRRITVSGSLRPVSYSYRAGSWCLKTSADRCYGDTEEAHAQLVQLARRKAKLGEHMPPNTLLVLQGGDDGLWLWTIAPWLPSLRSELAEAEAIHSHSALSLSLRRYAGASLEALLLLRSRRLALDIHPSNFAYANDQWVYIDDHIAAGERSTTIGYAWLARVDEYRFAVDAVERYIAELEDQIERLLTREDAEALKLEAAIQEARVQSDMGREARTRLVHAVRAAR